MAKPRFQFRVNPKNVILLIRWERRKKPVSKGRITGDVLQELCLGLKISSVKGDYESENAKFSVFGFLIL